MSLKAEVVLEWGGGEHLFALKGAQIEELQKLCDAGFGAIYQRVTLGVWFWADIHHIIRLGLIGGGMGAVEARRLTDMYIGRDTGEGRAPLAKGPNNPVSIANAVLGAVMFGMEDIPPGEAEAGESPATETAAEKSTSLDTEPPS